MPNLDVRITSMYPPGSQGGTRAIASATIADCFAVRGIKIVEGGKDGLFVSMPSRKTQDGYKDICFPVTAEFRKELHQAVLGAYEQALTMAQTAAPQAAAHLLWSSIFVTLVAKKYHESVTLPSGLRMVYDNH